MQAYELLFIVRADIEEERIANTITWVTNLIQERGGSIDKVDRWNKRRLAYEIKGQREGIYVLVNFEGDGSAIKEIDRLLKISDDVVRHTVLKRSRSVKKEPSVDKDVKKEQLPKEAEPALEPPSEMQAQAVEEPVSGV